ncbi:MAG: hypothetical protein ABI564_03235 [Ideonella sp.]
MQAPSHSTLVLTALLPLLAWRVYARFKRMVGRQRLTRYRLWIQLSLFPTLVVLIAVASLARPFSLLAFVSSLAAGAALGRYGLKTTRFEAVPGKLFYTPNAHLGIALSLLFVVRIAYRILEVYTSQLDAQHANLDFVRSPLTLLAFGLLAGYYISYAIGLALWRTRMLKARQLRLDRENR